MALLSQEPPKAADGNGASPAGAGVQYTPSVAAGAGQGDTATSPVPDLDSLPLQSQLSLGQARGVFTKITYTRDGVLARGRAVAPADGPQQDFVSSAVTTMRDYQEGYALLKGQTDAGRSAQANSFWSSGLRNLQATASRLREMV